MTLPIDTLLDESEIWNWRSSPEAALTRQLLRFPI